jgi:hypothetical protein
MSNAKGPGFMEGGKFAHRRLSAPGIEGSATDSPAFDALVLLSEARQWLRLFERDAGPEIRRGDLADLLARIDAAFGLAQPVAAPEPLTAERSPEFLAWWHEKGRDVVPWSPQDIDAAEIGFEAGRALSTQPGTEK